MSVFFAIQWTITEGGEEAMDGYLTAIRDHVERLHPTIRTVRLFRQYTGPMPHRSYLWMEEFASLTELDAEDSFPECDELWGPVRAMATPGSFFQSIFTDAGGGAWLSR